MKRPKLVTVKDPILVCGAYYWILARDATGILRWGLLAALWHECGHIAVWLALTHRAPRLEISLAGLCLRWQQAGLQENRLLVLALAGPAANLMLAAVLLAAMQWHASFAGYEFACCNLALAGFNLVPVPPLDGSYLCRFLIQKLHFHSK